MVLVMKKGSANFIQSVHKSLDVVSVDMIRKFSAKARRYMLAYKAFGSGDDDNNNNENIENNDTNRSVSYTEIEKFVRLFKTHHNTQDQEKGYILSVWRDAVGAS